MNPIDADGYFGKVLTKASGFTRSGRAQALFMYFQFLELRNKAEIPIVTGRVTECPLDEMNRPRAHIDTRLRVPPGDAEIDELFGGLGGKSRPRAWKYAPGARNCAVARLMADVGTADQRGTPS